MPLRPLFSQRICIKRSVADSAGWPAKMSAFNEVPHDADSLFKGIKFFFYAIFHIMINELYILNLLNWKWGQPKYCIENVKSVLSLTIFPLFLFFPSCTAQKKQKLIKRRTFRFFTFCFWLKNNYSWYKRLWCVYG